MMISKSRLRWVGVFARISGGKTIKGTTAATRSKNIQRNLFSTTTTESTSSFVSSKIGAMFVDHGPKNSLPKTIPVVVDVSRGHCCLSFCLSSSSSSSSSLSLQKRFRSALPEDYYEEEEDENDDSKEAPGTNTVGAAASIARTGTGTGTAPTPFLMADIGEGIAEVELLRWFITEGQTISEFDPVCEVQSDKATVEITSRYEGRVHKLAYQASGSMIRVGEPILWIQEPNTNSEDHDRPNDQHDPHEQTKENRELMDDPVVATNPTDSSMRSTTEASSKRETTEASTSATNSESSLMTRPKPQSGSSSLDAIVGRQEKNTDASLSVPIVSSEKILTSPAVRKLARDHALDLSIVVGTGPLGRIAKGDVLTVLKESAADSGPSTTVTATATAPTIGVESELDYPLREDAIVPLRGYNRIMAKTMTASLKIPHMIYSDEINLNRFVRYKMEHQQHADQKKLVFLPLAIKAASKALEKYPWLNASFDEEKQEATLWKDHNIGIAMDTPRGLIVPVLKHCQVKTLPEIAEELKRLKDSATCRGGELPSSDLQGATFTLSNVGAIGGGGTYMSPIITPPQVAIGAMGQIQRLPRFVATSQDSTASQKVEEAHICAVSWAADHRVVDGATVARFHKSWKEYMEDPIRLLLELQ